MLSICWPKETEERKIHQDNQIPPFAGIKQMLNENLLTVQVSVHTSTGKRI